LPKNTNNALYTIDILRVFIFAKITPKIGNKNKSKATQLHLYT